MTSVDHSTLTTTIRTRPAEPTALELHRPPTRPVSVLLKVPVAQITVPHIRCRCLPNVHHPDYQRQENR